MYLNAINQELCKTKLCFVCPIFQHYGAETGGSQVQFIWDYIVSFTSVSAMEQYPAFQRIKGRKREGGREGRGRPGGKEGVREAERSKLYLRY